MQWTFSDYQVCKKYTMYQMYISRSSAQSTGVMRIRACKLTVWLLRHWNKKSIRTTLWEKFKSPRYAVFYYSYFYNIMITVFILNNWEVWYFGFILNCSESHCYLLHSIENRWWAQKILISLSSIYMLNRMVTWETWLRCITQPGRIIMYQTMATLCCISTKRLKNRLMLQEVKLHW